MPSADNQEDCVKDLLLIQTLRKLLLWISELFTWISEGASADNVIKRTGFLMARRNTDMEVSGGGGENVKESSCDLG